jgi:hypothetical protein
MFSIERTSPFKAAGGVSLRDVYMSALVRFLTACLDVLCLSKVTDAFLRERLVVCDKTQRGVLRLGATKE